MMVTAKYLHLSPNAKDEDRDARHPRGVARAGQSAETV
jgi:hypothetical protein